MELALFFCLLCIVLRSGEGSEQKTDQRKGRDGWGPGGWETRNGVSSFGWDSRRPISCPRCSQTGEYRGNGYDNLSPEWQQREQGKHWPQGPGVGSGDGYGDKRVWSGTIRPIENQPGGIVTNWMGGPSRWRDPWEQRDVRYWHSTGGGYAGGYGYTQGSSFGYSQVGDNKPTTYYDRSRGETGYINHYDRRPWDDHYSGQQEYARGWDYYEQRPGTISGGGYTYRPPASYPYDDRKNLRDCNPCRQRPPPVRPTGGCCGARPSTGPAAPIGPNYRADFDNRYYQNHLVQDPSSGGIDYRPASVLTRPSPASYGNQSPDQNRPWQPQSSYGGPLTPEHFRPLPKPSYSTSGTDSGRPNPNYGRPNPDYGRPNPDYGRPNPDYGRPNPDYGRPAPDYGRPAPDYGSQNPDYGRPDISKPSPGNYGRPSTAYNPPPPPPDYGRPTTVMKPSPGDYGRPAPDYNQLPPVAPDYGRPQPPDYGQQGGYGRPATDYGRPPTDYRPQPDYGRPVVDYGRPQPDYGRPSPDYGRPGPDFSRPPIDYGRPGCATCRPDPDRPSLGQAGSYPRPSNEDSYDGYGSSGGYKPSGGHNAYGGGSGSYPAVSGGGDYGVGRPDDPRRDEHGDKSHLDRYPGHTGVGATFEFDSDRKQDSCLPTIFEKAESGLDNAPSLAICRKLEDFEKYKKISEEDESLADDPETVSHLMTEMLQHAIKYSNTEVKPVNNSSEYYNKFSEDEEEDVFSDDPGTISQLMNELLQQAIEYSNAEVKPAQCDEKIKC
ncbi:AT-rich interactive domain-containing protein 1A isoform X2 [Halyomorpha halys]|uniref:AT-rich interactive domain-containing protein 1A isoform X2 n=1 Tax=Halyomorpha halys TaxID=286706 RepID=UPI0006D4C951|nr:pro-resilin-like isoform X2 [Halyomorpha halys]